MLPRALILGVTPNKEPPLLQLAGRGEECRQERAVLLPPRLPADSKGSKAPSSACSEAGCSDRAFSQLCLGPACSITSCAHLRADVSLTVPHSERLQRSRGRRSLLEAPASKRSRSERGEQGSYLPWRVWVQDRAVGEAGGTSALSAMLFGPGLRNRFGSWGCGGQAAGRMGVTETECLPPTWAAAACSPLCSGDPGGSSHSAE